MFGKGIRLLKILGFEVRIDASWLLLLVLIILSLSSGYFPFHYEDLGTGSYVLMAVIGAIGLFASIIVHELCHSLVGRQLGIPMQGITLFMFGGVAQMEEESRNPWSEFLMAVAGPAASFVLAGGFYALHLGARSMDMPVAATGVLGYLAWINMILAFFNLLPAFPLDGGRILRSMLWGWKKQLRWATRISSEIGKGFGLVLILLGIMALLGGSIVGGLWWCLIGMFLRGISDSSYKHVLMREMLSGEPVRRFIREKPVSVPSDLSVYDLVEDYVYQHHFKMFPVIDDGKLIGCVTTRDVKNIPRESWKRMKVGNILRECSDKNTIPSEADARDALAKMRKTGSSRLLVVEDGRLLGMVALKDMMEFIATKLDLEGEEDVRVLGETGAAGTKGES